MIPSLRRIFSETDELLESVFESVESPRLLSDANDTTVRVNTAFLEQFGCRPEMAYRALRDRLARDLRTVQLFDRMTASAKAGNRTQAEVSFEGPSG